MSDFPKLSLSTPETINPGCITTAHPEMLGRLLDGLGVSLGSSLTWGSASRATYFPFYINAPTTIYQLAWYNRTTVSGNVDIGIYDRSAARLVSAGGVAQSGANAFQFVDIADTALGIGQYWLAFVLDNTTGTVEGVSTGVQVAALDAVGVREEAAAYTLPATATFVTPTQTRVPKLIMTTNSAL